MVLLGRAGEKLKKLRKKLIYIVGIIFLIGGIMGLIKALFPEMGWLSIRYILGNGGTYSINEYPLYARVYGGIMAVIEIGMAIIILLWKKKLFFLCIIGILINIVACIVAVLIGDYMAMLSLVIRLIPLYLFREESKIEIRNR